MIKNIISLTQKVNKLVSLNQYNFIPSPLVENQYQVTPRLHVPDHINKPGYITGKDPIFGFLEGKPVKHNEETLKKLRAAGKITSQTAEYIQSITKIGVSTDEIDKKLHEFVLSKNAYPTPLGWSYFPKSVCTSVNDVCCHGIPDTRKLKNGDFLNIDISIYKDGVHGDSSVMCQIGQVDPAVKKMIDITQKSLHEAIKLCKPGLPYKKIGEFIQKFILSHGYWVSEYFTGHGVGQYLHQPPQVFHNKNDCPYLIEEGHVFTIEPVVLLKKPENYIMWHDNFTIQCTGIPSAQWEHTIEMTNGKPKVLTQRSTETIPGI